MKAYSIIIIISISRFINQSSYLSIYTSEQAGILCARSRERDAHLSRPVTVIPFESWSGWQWWLWHSSELELDHLVRFLMTLSRTSDLNCSGISISARSANATSGVSLSMTSLKFTN